MAVIEATTENFDELIRTAEYAVVDFYGDHCGACEATAPHYREVSDDMAFIRFIKVNTSVERKLAKHFHIFGIPAFRYFYKGELMHESVGGMDTRMLHEQIAKMLYPGMDEMIEK